MAFLIVVALKCTTNIFKTFLSILSVILYLLQNVDLAKKIILLLLKMFLYKNKNIASDTEILSKCTTMTCWEFISESLIYVFKIML